MTGQGGDVRLVPSKREIGLWYFELVCLLPNGLPFLLLFSIAEADEATNISTPVVVTTGQWLQLIQRHEKPPGGQTIIVWDAFYADRATVELYCQQSAPFMCSVKPGRFKDVHELVSADVTKPGEWNAAFNANTNELYVHHWSRHTNVGKKSVLTNTMIRTNTTRRGKKSFLIPAYDAYKEMFSICDIFNRNLRDRSWPLRQGGRDKYAEPGVEHNFAFSAVLQNVFSTYLSINKPDEEYDYEYSAFCTALADELFAHAVALVE